MIKPVSKSLSFAFVTLAAAVSPAAAQTSSLEMGAMPIESVRFACSPQAEIERGWEYQQALIEARLAAKPAEAFRVPGAIISPPFAKFAPYRTDLPVLTSARKTGKPSSGVDGRFATRASTKRL